MELDVDPKVGAVVATAAVVASPPVRRLLHQGIVLGVTGLLFVTDAIGSLGRGVVRGVRGGDGNGGAEKSRSRRPRKAVKPAGEE